MRGYHLPPITTNNPRRASLGAAFACALTALFLIAIAIQPEDAQVRESQLDIHGTPLSQMLPRARDAIASRDAALLAYDDAVEDPIKAAVQRANDLAPEASLTEESLAAQAVEDMSLLQEKAKFERVPGSLPSIMARAVAKRRIHQLMQADWNRATKAPVKKHKAKKAPSPQWSKEASKLESGLDELDMALRAHRGGPGAAARSRVMALVEEIPDAYPESDPITPWGNKDKPELQLLQQLFQRGPHRHPPPGYWHRKCTSRLHKVAHANRKAMRTCTAAARKQYRAQTKGSHGRIRKCYHAVHKKMRALKKAGMKKVKACKKKKKCHWRKLYRKLKSAAMKTVHKRFKKCHAARLAAHKKHEAARTALHASYRKCDLAQRQRIHAAVAKAHACIRKHHLHAAKAAPKAKKAAAAKKKKKKTASQRATKKILDQWEQSFEGRDLEKVVFPDPVGDPEFAKRNSHARPDPAFSKLGEHFAHRPINGLARFRFTAKRKKAKKRKGHAAKKRHHHRHSSNFYSRHHQFGPKVHRWNGEAKVIRNAWKEKLRLNEHKKKKSHKKNGVPPRPSSRSPYWIRQVLCPGPDCPQLQQVPDLGWNMDYKRLRAQAASESAKIANKFTAHKVQRRYDVLPAFYQHCGYRGARTFLNRSLSDVGKHHKSQRRDFLSGMSSFKLPYGWCATLFAGRKYKGRRKTFCGAKVQCLKGHPINPTESRISWNNRVLSVRVYKDRRLPKPTKRFIRNCMTTKVYATVVSEQLKEQSEGTLGVVKPFLQALAARHGNCLRQYAQVMKQLRHRRGTSLPDSLERHMLRLIHHSIVKGDGILAWAKISGETSKHAGMNVMNSQVKTYSAQGQRVFINGKRVGLSGTPPSFRDGLAVRVTAMMSQAARMKVTKSMHIVGGPDTARSFGQREANILFKGRCHGAVSLSCKRFTNTGPRGCRRQGCQWVGPWKGNEEEEETSSEE